MRSQPRSFLQWLGIALAVAVVVILCLSLGRWQWSRHVNKDARIDTIAVNYSADPVALSEVVPSPSDAISDSQVWTPVSVRGTYVPQATALLRNRPIASTPSVHVLVPLETEDGAVLLVNRGWVPYDVDVTRPSTIPAPPTGLVTVTVHLRHSEARVGRDAPDGQVQSITVADALVAGATYGGLEQWPTMPVYEHVYGSLIEEDPAPTTAMRALPEPDTDPGSHLSYALQWWVFAIGAGAGFFVLVVREHRSRRAPVSSEYNPFAALNAQEGTSRTGKQHGAGQRKTRHIKDVDADYEDSLFVD